MQSEGVVAQEQKYQKIRILGHGAVVRAFLMNATAQFPNFSFEVYCRKRASSSNSRVCFKSIDEVSNEDDFLFYCCSTDEERILANSSTPSSRFAVAEANLKITDEYILAGLFNRGPVFVLTNPSELIAEEIRLEIEQPQCLCFGIKC